MSRQQLLIEDHFIHLEKMDTYLEYSHNKVKSIIPIKDVKTLTSQEHETLAAFRIRFSEFQEHIAKTMRAVAIEEEIDVERFGTVLSFMVKIGVLESVKHWKFIRELRNSINHEYEDDSIKLNEFFVGLVRETYALRDYYGKLKMFVNHDFSEAHLR